MSHAESEGIPPLIVREWFKSREMGPNPDVNAMNLGSGPNSEATRLPTRVLTWIHFIYLPLARREVKPWDRMASLHAHLGKSACLKLGVMISTITCVSNYSPEGPLQQCASLKVPESRARANFLTLCYCTSGFGSSPQAHTKVLSWTLRCKTTLGPRHCLAQGNLHVESKFGLEVDPLDEVFLTFGSNGLCSTSSQMSNDTGPRKHSSLGGIQLRCGIKFVTTSWLSSEFGKYIERYDINSETL